MMTGTVIGLSSDSKSWVIAQRSIVRAVLIAALTITLPSFAIGQIDPADQSEGDIDTAGLVIEAALGWDGTVDQSTPIPVSFLIRNSSDRIIEGHLTLSDSMAGHEVSLGEVIIAPGTARSLASIQDMSNWYECIATLRDGEGVLWRRELALSTGQQFYANVNFALFIDNGGRKLQFPGAVSSTAAIAATDLVVAGKKGRPIQCLTVKPWQMPNHPAPLAVAQAMVFREGMADADLNRVQWRAVAEWICQGGIAFVHNESSEVIERLKQSAPLNNEAAVPSGEFKVRRIGLGAIYEYARPLFASEGTEIRQLIAETIAKLSKHHISTLVDSGHVYRQRGGRADRNRFLVIGFFGVYTLLSGVVALLLFRLSQRRIAAYTIVVVVGASILSGLLGGMLRFSQGDLYLVTVTQAGAGGVVQVAKINLQSAGGRNTQVAINGKYPDLQFVGREPNYYPWDRQPTGYAPFTWQPNLAIGEEDTYQINVPMTPWGRRRLHATAYNRDLRRMKFELKFEPHNAPSDNAAKTSDNVSEPTTTAGMPAGSFSLKLVNHLPFDVTECWLIIGVTHKLTAQAAATQAVANQTGRYGRYGWQQSGATVSADGLIDVYHMQRLQGLSAGATYEKAFEAEFQIIDYDWDMVKSWAHGSLTPPRISRMGTTSAWIVGRIENSPSIVIDEQRSDFVPQNQLHLFIQEILPTDMPDASLFFDAETDEATESIEAVPR
jgi:hypothetical protein